MQLYSVHYQHFSHPIPKRQPVPATGKRISPHKIRTAWSILELPLSQSVWRGALEQFKNCVHVALGDIVQWWVQWCWVNGWTQLSWRLSLPSSVTLSLLLSAWKENGAASECKLCLLSLSSQMWQSLWLFVSGDAQLRSEPCLWRYDSVLPYSPSFFAPRNHSEAELALGNEITQMCCNL